jgi:single-strand DNA-binding protein
LSLATSKRWNKDGQKQEKTEWHTVKCFNKTAEIAGQYVKKGDQILVEGEMTYRQWQAKDGSNRTSAEVIINQLHLLGSKKQDQDYGKQELREDTQSDKPFEITEEDLPF